MTITAPVRQGPLSGPGTLFGWRITSYYGGRVDPLTGRPGNHSGMDLAHGNCYGADLLAVLFGDLAQNWDNSGGGNWSGLTLDNGDYWGYGHALGDPPYQRGTRRRVNTGEPIALCGSTGASTGAHLHIAYRPAGSYVYRDPYDQLVAAALGGVPIPDLPAKDWFDMATKEDLTAALTEALAARPPVVVGGAHPVCQINNQLWYITEDDGVVKRRWISGPVELKFLQDVGIAQTGPVSNLGPEVEGEFYSTPRLPIDETGNVGPEDRPGG